MDILNPRSLREEANRALARGRDPKKLVFTYAGIGLGLSVLMTLLDLWLENEISGTGGLSNLGTRAIFSTAQEAIPILVSLLTMCLELGYLSGMLRISRGQYADHTDLKVGFQKFWPLMRLSLLQSLLIMAVGILAVQLGGLLFSLTPWAEPAMNAVLALSTMDPAVLTEADVLALLDHMLPMYLIAGILFLLGMIPVLFRLRMAMFCLLDDPNGRAMAAIGTSNRMMRRRFGPMLKVDLSQWLYYAGTFLVLLVLSSTLILPLLNLPLPMDATAYYLLISIAAAVLQFIIQVTLRNKVEATYLTAYNRLREKPKDNGVVLGNIFDM